MSSALLSGTLTSLEAAKFLGVHVQTVKNWRAKGTGPEYMRIGRIIAYHEEDLRAWVYKNSN